MMKKDPIATKTKILDAALTVIRTKGYSATSVDDLCEAAGVTKGAFFHHFATKEQLAVEAATHFGTMADGLFTRAPFQQLADPVDRLLGYVDFRIAILQGSIPDFTCLLGTLVQEVHCTSPAIREECDAQIRVHTDFLEKHIAAALKGSTTTPTWTISSLANYIQAVIQGALILAKAKGGPEVASECLDHLRNYLQLILPAPKHSIE